MRISVTQRHINNGQRGSPCSCAIALAIAEALPGVVPDVTPVIVYLVGGVRLGLPRTASLPPEVTAFIRRFDEWGSATPFEFDLPIEMPAAACVAAARPNRDPSGRPY